MRYTYKQFLVGALVLKFKHRFEIFMQGLLLAVPRSEKQYTVNLELNTPDY